MADVRSFRRAIAVLKKRGLVTEKTKAGYSIDARSIRPGTILSSGKRAESLVKKYDDVLSGKVTPLKVAPEKLRAYRKQGYETSRGRVMVPHGAGEVAYLDKGNIAIRDASGIVRVQLPVEYHNIPAYLKALKRNAKKINAMKRKNEWFGIRFFGNHRANFYRAIEDLIAALEQYDTLMNPPASHSKQFEIFQNLEILKISPKATREWETSATSKRAKMRAEYNRKRAAAFRKRLKKAPEFKKHEYRTKAAERNRAYRKRLKKNKAQYSKYLKAGRKRALASQKAAKKKTRGKKGKKK